MTTRTVEQVDEWESRSFSGGYRGLQDLSDENFSGIVAAGPTRLCLTKGKVVGILDGDIEDFEDASGTVYEAPSPALPLLAVMQDRSDEVRAEYYTEETAIEEVDRTLTQGNFTGFVVLSENVLSGDYYLVYHQGRSMSVAWVGESGQLLTEDEAFERANDEVGIYEVRPVDIDVIDIPEVATTGGAADAGSAAAATAEADAAADASAATDAGQDATDSAAAASDAAETAEPDGEEATEADPADDQATAQDEGVGADEAEESVSASGAEPTESQPSGGTRGGSQSGAGAGRSADAPSEAQAGSGTRTGEAGSGHQGGGGREAASSQAGGTRSGGGQGRGTQGGAPQDDSAGQGGGQQPSGGHRGGRRSDTSDRSDGAGGVGELETRSIPSLDPDRSSGPGGETTGGGDAETRGANTQGQSTPGGQPPADNPSGQRQAGGQGEQAGGRQPADRARGQGPAGGQPRQQAGGANQQRDHAGAGEQAGGAGAVEDLEAELREREADIERLESELSEAEQARDELRTERDELEERVEQLERRINELRTEEGGESIADRERMSPGEVIEGTNLFVRYDSKGEATLEDAFNGNAESGAVNDNLEVQHHTQFEAEDVAVNGEPFTTFLEGTLQHQFVDWVVRVLPYEIRDTGHEESLKTLYEALPQIDRAELNGVISVVYEEDGEEQRTQERFDIVLRDRMGNPLAVANMNESRQPASQSMMESLIAAAQRVGESKESLAGAFLVTSSFFEPEAMEAAADATGSGLLSRDKRQSFVKLSRKDGFHLCLVEAREEQFNLSVPEI
jgi:hypothetical protein